MYRLILIFCLLFIVSCSSNDTSVLLTDQNLYKDNELKDFELFDKANNYIVSNQLDLALTNLDKLDVLFPSSLFTNRGMLVKAYIYFLKEDYEKTRAISENYKQYYPGSKDIVYANYLEAMTYYILIKKPEYSQKNSYEALKKFNFILNAYPNSKYEIDIITKMQILDNNIAKNKLTISIFYLDKKNINGALIYLKDIFNNHSSSLAIEETLYYIVKIYDLLEEDDLAKEYASILAYNFPNSKWYEMSYNMLNDIEITENKETWFSKYNPIKLFIKEQVEESFEIQKMD